jgi:hypothetical protein
MVVESHIWQSGQSREAILERGPTLGRAAHEHTMRVECEASTYGE